LGIELIWHPAHATVRAMLASHVSVINALTMPCALVIAYAFPPRFRSFVLLSALAVCAVLTIVAFWAIVSAYFIGVVAGLLGFGFVATFAIYRMYPSPRR
jgi:hypothetical protein